MAGLGMENGEPVSAEQMRSLFGEGRHPDAPFREAAVAERSGSFCETREGCGGRS